MENTLAQDLRAIAALYEWAEEKLALDLDRTLAQSQIPTGRVLQSLVGHLRQPNEHMPDLVTVALKISAIRRFLTWAADPKNLGSSLRKSIHKIAEQRQELDEVFAYIGSYASSSRRIRPITQDESAEIEKLFGPRRDDENAIVMPLQFRDENPFWPENRLRNWLMWNMAMEYGHRRGELLKTRTDDLPKPGNPGIKIRRRPHDKTDTRRNKPRVKTVERVLPESPFLKFSLRAYLTGDPPCGRPRVQSPYLFLTSKGHPLSISATDAIMQVVSRHTGIPDISWHSWRHAWAEAVAAALMKRYPEDRAMDMLRELGGWRRGSSTPQHYIQGVIKKQSYEFLRERNDRLYTAEDIK